MRESNHEWRPASYAECKLCTKYDHESNTCGDGKKITESLQVTCPKGEYDRTAIILRISKLDETVSRATYETKKLMRVLTYLATGNENLALMLF